MKRPQLRAHTKVLLAMLAAVVGLLVYSTIDRRVAERQLTAMAADRIDAQFTERQQEHLEFAKPAVTVTRAFLVFGEEQGKVAIYFRPRESPETPQQAATQIAGFEYIFEKRDGEWVKTESARCGSEQSRRDGRRAFERGIYDTGDTDE